MKKRGLSIGLIFAMLVSVLILKVHVVEAAKLELKYKEVCMHPGDTLDMSKLLLNVPKGAKVRYCIGREKYKRTISVSAKGIVKAKEVDRPTTVQVYPRVEKKRSWPNLTIHVVPKTYTISNRQILNPTQAQKNISASVISRDGAKYLKVKNNNNSAVHLSNIDIDLCDEDGVVVDSAPIWDLDLFPGEEWEKEWSVNVEAVTAKIKSASVSTVFAYCKKNCDVSIKSVSSDHNPASVSDYYDADPNTLYYNSKGANITVLIKNNEMKDAERIKCEFMLGDRMLGSREIRNISKRSTCKSVVYFDDILTGVVLHMKRRFGPSYRVYDSTFYINEIDTTKLLVKIPDCGINYWTVRSGEYYR